MSRTHPPLLLGLGALALMLGAAGWWLRATRDAGDAEAPPSGEAHPEVGAAPTNGHSEPERASAPAVTRTSTQPAPSPGNREILAQVELQGAEVRGVVHTDRHEPVEGARVRLTVTGPSRESPPVEPPEQRSDEEGRFRVRGIPAGEWVVRIAATQGGVTTLPLLLSGDQRENLGILRLRGGQELAVRVVDPADRAVPAAVLRFFGEATERELRTDAEGFVALGFVESGFYSMHAEHPSMLAPGVVRVEVPSARDVLTLRLRAAPSLHGIVVDEQGRPIAGARARCSGASLGELESTAVSGPDGAFALAAPATEGLTLTVEALGYRAASHENLHAGSDPLRIVLPRGVVLRGTASAVEDHRPVLLETANANFFLNDHRIRKNLALDRRADGSFELSFGHDFGEVELVLDSAGFQPWVSERIDLQQPPTEPLEVLFFPELIVEVRVLAEGRALPGARMELRRGAPPVLSDAPSVIAFAREQWREIPSWKRVARSDEQGRATLRGVGFGPHWLRIQAAGRVVVEQAIAVHEGTRVEIELPRGQQIGGRVTTTAGEPWSGALLLAAEDGRHRRTTTDAEGRYEFDGVEVGRYRVVPQPEGVPLLMPWQGRWLRSDAQANVSNSRAPEGDTGPELLEVRAGEALVHDLRVDLPAAGALSGVVEVDGRPAPDLHLSWRWQGESTPGREPLFTRLGWTRSDARGRFSFPRVHGPLRLFVHDDAFQIAHVEEDIKVQAGEHRQLLLSIATGRVRLEVRGANGAAIPAEATILRERVRSLRSAGGATATFPLIETSEGVFERSGLRPGEYRWSCDAPGFEHAWGTIMVPAGGEATHQVTLQGGGWILAELSFADRRQPPSSVRYRLEARAPDGDMEWEGTARRSADGRYWLSTQGMEADHVEVTVWADTASLEHSRCRGRAQARLQSGERTELSLRLDEG